jgi:pyruvate,water dikinase
MTAARELNLPITAFEHRYRNNFLFERTAPLVSENDEEAHRHQRLAKDTIEAQIPLLGDRWRTEHLPRVQEILQQLRMLNATASDTLPPPSTVDELVSLLEELWAIHFRIAIPMGIALQVFDEFFADLFGPEADAHALTAGRYSASVRADIALSDLAGSARLLGLAGLFSESTPEMVLTRLDESQEGRQFANQLARFLEEFGLRQDLFDFITPTWRERPEIVIAGVRGYLENGRDNRAEHEKRARIAEAATDSARAALSSYPEPVRAQFEVMLEAGRAGAFLQEEHNFYIDQQGLALVRLIFLQIGRTLAQAGTIEAADDIFMLHDDEIRAALAGERSDLKAVARDRRASFETSRHATPPPYIGAPPEAPSGEENTFSRAMIRFFGGPPQESGDPNVIRGMAGSRGTVSGTAFIARTLEEATDISPGEILVAITTMPPWTPLFGIAAAVVAETGGPLSHCAIVAREYGIPAVVGAHGATQRIQHGQTITVDGTNGVVTLHD